MKRVVLYRFDRQPAEGFVHPDEFLLGSNFEFMNADGELLSVSHRDMKGICFASETARPDLFTANNFFERRPKTSGLWARFLLRDQDRLEGLLPHNLADWPATGYLFIPPRTSGGRQRVFLPRTAVLSTELLGVVGTSASAGQVRKPAKTAGAAGQLKMFDP